MQLISIVSTKIHKAMAAPGTICGTFDDSFFRLMLMRAIAWSGGKKRYGSMGWRRTR
jgi:hypothetical protein